MKYWLPCNIGLASNLRLFIVPSIDQLKNHPTATKLIAWSQKVPPPPLDSTSLARLSLSLSG